MAKTLAKAFGAPLVVSTVSRLLVLRVDRAMSWNDVARVMLEDGEDDSDEAIGRVAGRLRKRFQSVKETIRTRAAATGLLGELEPDGKE